MNSFLDLVDRIRQNAFVGIRGAVEERTGDACEAVLLSHAYVFVFSFG